MSAIAMTVGDLKEVLNKFPDFYEIRLQTGEASIESLYAGNVGAMPIVSTTTYRGRSWLVLEPDEAVVEMMFY